MLYMPLGLTVKKNSTFCPQINFTCFYVSHNKQRPIAVYNIKLLVFVTETDSVYSAVRTEFLIKTDYISSLKG